MDESWAIHGMIVAFVAIGHPECMQDLNNNVAFSTNKAFPVFIFLVFLLFYEVLQP